MKFKSELVDCNSTHVDSIAEAEETEVFTPRVFFLPVDPDAPEAPPIFEIAPNVPYYYNMRVLVEME